MNSLEDILDKYVSNYNLKVLGFRESGQENVKQAIYKDILSIVLETIGEDYEQRLLRAELRKAISEWTGIL